MKRSSNISLVVMGTLAFTATFAGGSAFLAARNPAQPQNCATTAAAGTPNCVTARASTGFARYFPFHLGMFPERMTGAAPASQLASTGSGLVSGAPVGGTRDATGRGGFGASARAAHASAAS